MSIVLQALCLPNLIPWINELPLLYNHMGFPGGSEVKASAWNVGDPGSILGREDPLEKEMAIHSSTLAWRIPWREEPGGLQSMESQSWTWLTNFTFTFHFHALEREMAAHSSVLAWRIPRMGKPVGLPSMGSHRVRHDWSNLAAAATAGKTTRPRRYDLSQIPYDYTERKWEIDLKD